MLMPIATSNFRPGFAGLWDDFVAYSRTKTASPAADAWFDNIGSSIMGLPRGTAQQNNSAPNGVFSAVDQFTNPSIDSSTLAANYYQAIQYGAVPPLPEAVAGETPQQYAARVQQILEEAQASGSWSDVPSLPTASDNSALYVGLAIAAVVGLMLYLLPGGQR